MRNRILLTGGAGFIGHHVAEHYLRNTDAEIVFLDRLDTSGSLGRIVAIDGWDKYRSRCRWVWHDLRAPVNYTARREIGEVEVVLHLAASTHVDRSIMDPLSFVYDNVVGTANILDFARHHNTLQKFLYFSTDEVFGPADWGYAFDEWDAYRSGNPYAATKAGGEELCLAYENTYKLPVVITHTMNVYGERQHHEKFIPKVVRKVVNGDRVQIHSDSSKTRSGSRSYIDVRDVASAVDFVVHRGKSGEKYNVVGEREVSNLDLATKIAEICGKPLHYDMVDFHSSRPGHDLRYALSGRKLATMGWKHLCSFEESLARTVKWELEHL